MDKAEKMAVFWCFDCLCRGTSICMGGLLCFNRVEVYVLPSNLCLDLYFCGLAD